MKSTVSLRACVLPSRSEMVSNKFSTVALKETIQNLFDIQAATLGYVPETQVELVNKMYVQFLIPWSSVLCNSSSFSCSSTTAILAIFARAGNLLRSAFP